MDSFTTAFKALTDAIAANSGKSGFLAGLVLGLLAKYIVAAVL